MTRVVVAINLAAGFWCFEVLWLHARPHAATTRPHAGLSSRAIVRLSELPFGGLWLSLEAQSLVALEGAQPGPWILARVTPAARGLAI